MALRRPATVSTRVSQEISLPARPRWYPRLSSHRDAPLPHQPAAGTPRFARGSAANTRRSCESRRIPRRWACLACPGSRSKRPTADVVKRCGPAHISHQFRRAVKLLRHWSCRLVYSQPESCRHFGSMIAGLRLSCASSVPSRNAIRSATSSSVSRSSRPAGIADVLLGLVASTSCSARVTFSPLA